MRIAMIGAFGLRSTGTLTRRARPLAKALVERGHQVELVVPPWDNPSDARREWTAEGVEIKNTGVRLKPLIAPRLAGEVSKEEKETLEQLERLAGR